MDEIVSFHRQNGGMSRFDKFDYIYKNILKKPLTSQRKEELSDQFSILVFEKILSAPFVQGAYEFLKKFHTSIPLYVVSATPEHELIQIISRRGLTPFFHGIYGSPRKKRDCILEIIEQTGTGHSDIIFVGDAKNDLDAAVETGIRFIGRKKPGTGDIFTHRSEVEFIISDLNRLDKYIEENS
jgi:phosphoglycolate phosphatase-like HAD superfamily hydrolase